MSEWKEIRCPKCKHINPIVKTCQKCGSEILDTLNAKLKWYSKFMEVRKITWLPSLILTPLFVIVLLLNFIGEISSSSFYIIAIPFNVVFWPWFLCYCFCRDLGPDISQYNPDQSVDLLRFVTRLLALTIGAEIVHHSISAISHGIDGATDGVIGLNVDDLTTTSVPTFDIGHASAFDIVHDPNIVDANAVSMAHAAHSTVLNHAVDSNHFAPDSTHYTIVDHMNMTEAHVDVHGSIANMSDNLGMPIAHVEHHFNSDLIADNLGIPVGYIDHTLIGDSIIKNSLGITRFSVDRTGAIFDVHSLKVGNIERVGDVLVLKDLVGDTLHSVNMN